MLAKLNRSKVGTFFLVLSFTFVSSCGLKKSSGETFFKKEKIIYSHTIISCPGQANITLRYASAVQVEEAVRRAYEKKKKEQTNETYTAIRFSKNRSMRVSNVPPEDMMKCSFFEIPLTEKEKEKAHFFFR